MYLDIAYTDNILNNCIAYIVNTTYNNYFFITRYYFIAGSRK